MKNNKKIHELMVFHFYPNKCKKMVLKNPEFKNNGTKEWTNICKQTKEQRTAKRATKKSIEK